MSSADALRRDLLHLLSDPTTRHMVVDLSHITFCDSSGPNVFVIVDHHARATGTGLEFVNPSAHMRKILRITGLADVLPIESGGHDRPIE